MWPWFYSPPPAGESNIQRESCLLSLYLPKARCIRMWLDYAKYLFTPPWAKKDRNRDLWHERTLYLFMAPVRKLLSLCCVVLWPNVWSYTTIFIHRECGYHRCCSANLAPSVTFWIEKVNRILGPLNSFALTQWLLFWPIVKLWKQTLDIQEIFYFPLTQFLLFRQFIRLSSISSASSGISHIFPFIPTPPCSSSPTTSGLIMGKL